MAGIKVVIFMMKLLKYFNMHDYKRVVSPQTRPSRYFLSLALLLNFMFKGLKKGKTHIQKWI